MQSKTNYEANVKALVAELGDGFQWLQDTYANYDEPEIMAIDNDNGNGDDGVKKNPPSFSSLSFLRQELDKPAGEEWDEEEDPLSEASRRRTVYVEEQQGDGIRYEYRWMAPVAKIIFLLVLAVLCFIIWAFFFK